uniref:Pleckstrin homology domain containing, family O member 1a n=1 Tax=Cynoglossus semilaevis TaxID=244447 RepID=A0A3P8X0H8_CYNSE
MFDAQVKDERKAQEVLDLADYERSEELRKAKSRSKKNHSRFTLLRSRRPGSNQPEKSGWIRKFCGRGIFRELWRNRFVVLRGTHLFISDREVKDERKAQEVLDLADYERSEELRKAKSRSKKNHSRFTLLRSRRPGSNVPNLVFLAFSPEEKESWVNAINVAIVKAKNRRVLDEVTIEEGGALAHPTRDRAKVPRGRRLPTRGHLLSVASTSSRGMLTLDLVAEEDSCSLDDDADSSFQVDRCDGHQDVGGRGRAPPPIQRMGSSVSFSFRPAMVRPDLRRRRPTEDESVGGACEQPVAQPVGQLQSLIAQRMQRAQEMLEEMSDSPRLRPKESPRLRGRESPRTKAKKNRCKRGDSPRSRRPQSPVAKANASPHDSPPSKMSDASVASNDHGLLAEKSPQSSVSIGEGVSSQVHSADSRQLHVNGDDNCSHVTGSQGSPRHIQDAVTLCPSQEKNVDSPLEDDPPTLVSLEEAARRRAEAERLLEEAVSSWKEAQEVLQEVRELQRQRRETNSRCRCDTQRKTSENELKFQLKKLN